MSAMKIIGLSLGILFVVLFEAAFLGHYQPRLESTGIPMLVITTTDADGEPDSRRLTRLEIDVLIYVSAHHWPRGWYHRAVVNPSVMVEIEGDEGSYTAVVMEGEELDMVATRVLLGFVVRLMM